MAVFVVITDEGGVVRVEKRPTPFREAAIGAKKIIDVIRDAGQAVNPVTIASKYSDVGVVLAEVERSDRLTPEEKAEIRGRLLNFDYVTDSVKYQAVPGEFTRTHPVNDVPAPPTYPPVTRVVDP